MTAPNHDAFVEMVAAYALGALDAADRRSFEAHLATCAACQRELAGMQRVTAGLGMAADPVAPPETLKAKTIAGATSQPQAAPVPSARRPVPNAQLPVPAFLLAAASLAIAIGAGFYAWSLRTQLQQVHQTVDELSARANDLRNELDRARRESVRLSNVIDILQAPGTIQVSLSGAGAAPNALGRASFNPGKGMVVSTEQLPALAPGRTYQLWVIVGAGKPVGAGVFTVNNGSATVTATVPPSLNVPRGSAVTIAVTDEPAGGSNQPTTDPLLAGVVKSRQM